MSANRDSRKTLTESEMAKADAYDHEAEMAGIIADYEAELASEAAEEEALCADIRRDEALDRMVEHMERMEGLSYLENRDDDGYPDDLYP